MGLISSIATLLLIIPQFSVSSRRLHDIGRSGWWILINFTITLLSGCLNKLLVKNIEHGCNEFEKVFKLYTTKRTTNMHLFDSNNKLLN